MKNKPIDLNDRKTWPVYGASVVEMKPKKTGRPMKETVINARGYGYMSEIPEFKDGLPHGVLNKLMPDVGGTFVTLNCDSNYIIVTPTVDLIYSIMADKNNRYEVFGVYGGVFYADFKEYVLKNEIHKIAVTWDSLPKVVRWLNRNGFDSKKYKVLIDEYHLLLEDLGFRENAINKLMDEITNFEHFTFMSATPIMDIFLPKCLENLPQTIITWDKVSRIQLQEITSKNVFSSTVRIINQFKEGKLSLDVDGEPTKVEELYIFLNSVQGIEQIIGSAKLTDDEVKVVCSDRFRNRMILHKSGVEISKVTEPNAPINFFTKKGFQGCNLFTNNGLMIVVSDTQKTHTLVDISTTMHQIVGRLRTNGEYNNVFRNYVWHIHSRAKNVKSDEEFKVDLDNLKRDSEIFVRTYNAFDPESKRVYKKRIVDDDIIYYYDDKLEEYIYSELKVKYLIYNHYLLCHVYQNGISIRESYRASKFDTADSYVHIGDNKVLLKQISSVSFKTLLQIYIALRNEGTDHAHITEYEYEYPIFREAYDKLGESGIKTCNYVRSAIQEALEAQSYNTLSVVYKKFYDEVGEGSFVSNRDAKLILREIFSKYRFTRVKPTVTILDGCRWFTVQRAKKRRDGRQVDGIILCKVSNDKISILDPILAFLDNQN
jgi:hypothetical protein